ncbi:MAG: hypothetical protein ACPIOQ_28865, partial [Promethearchaeia archaeon]
MSTPLSSSSTVLGLTMGGFETSSSCGNGRGGEREDMYSASRSRLPHSNPRTSEVVSAKHGAEKADTKPESGPASPAASVPGSNEEDDDLVMETAHAGHGRKHFYHVHDSLSEQSFWRRHLKLIFGIGPADEMAGVPASRLIYPLSSFGLMWIFLTAGFLGYTAVVTLPVIAYYWLEDECTEVPTL